MKKLIFLIAVSSFVSYSCQENPKFGKRFRNYAAVEKRDTTITVENAYNELFLDSTKLESFIEANKYGDSLANQFRSFYNSRNYQYAWFSNDGASEQANNFFNLQNDYIFYSRDSSLFNAQLQHTMDTLNSNDSSYRLSASERLNTELLLTSQFFNYAQRAYLGDNKLNTTDLKWFIPRKKIDMVSLLDSMMKQASAGTDVYEPVNRQYKLLKKELIRYSTIEKEGGWEPVSKSQKKFMKGDTALAVSLIKKRLYKTGDFSSSDTSNLFTDSLRLAVMRMQKRYGMKEDGVVGGATLREMNQSIQYRIRQLLVNLERLRWVPTEVTTDYLLVNIPQFKLHVYEKGNLAFSMNVVVGSLQHNTVIFTGDLKYVVFSPFWNVPSSIVKNEIMPGIQKNKNYIASHNMEITGYSGKMPIVRQKPGPNNSLGKVKFLFPNRYNIYLHDTPAKSLFGETSRAFSHGCIRLGEPGKLANFLLRNDNNWTDAKIRQAMDAGKEKYVTLTKAIPVFIGYFTAWVGSDGLLNFRDDVYGHDAKVAEKMFVDGKLFN